jgi:hypothetical protein
MQALVQQYNEKARYFQVLYALNRHYCAMAIAAGERDTTLPIDLNMVYAKLSLLRKTLEAGDAPQAEALIAGLDKLLASAWHWFEVLDRKVTAFWLRSYCEKHSQEFPTDQQILILQFLLSKGERNDGDQAKIDYLLTQAFCATAEDGVPRLRAASEAALKEEIGKLLPRHLRQDRPETAVAEQECERFMQQLKEIITFEALVSGDYINKGRQLKKSFGPYFYTAPLLAKAVQINVVLRQKFTQLYKVENEKIREFSEILIRTGKDVVSVSPDLNITPEKAREFSERSEQLFRSEYQENRERLRTFVQIREMLDKTVATYGLDPYYGTPEELDQEELSETRLNERLQQRYGWLREQTRQIPEHMGSVYLLALEHSRLVLSVWERAALMQGVESMDPVVRETSDLLARSAAIMAEINESYCDYSQHRLEGSPLSDIKLMAVNYFVIQAHQMAEQLERWGNELRQVDQTERACDMIATKHKLMDTCWKLKL